MLESIISRLVESAKQSATQPLKLRATQQRGRIQTMLTFEEATTAREFHYNGHNQCSVSVGPRGGVKVTQLIARRNGNTQLWKTRPTEYRTPIIHGLKGYGSITHQDSEHWHTNDTCPLVLAESHVWSEVIDIPSDYSERMRAVQSHLEQCADCREGKQQ